MKNKTAKISKKQLRKPATKAKPTKPKRNNVNFILSDAELADTKKHIAELSSDGPPIKLGAYAKHAMLMYPALQKRNGDLLETERKYNDLAQRIARPLIPTTMEGSGGGGGGGGHGGVAMLGAHEVVLDADGRIIRFEEPSDPLAAASWAAERLEQIKLSDAEADLLTGGIATFSDDSENA